MICEQFYQEIEYYFDIQDLIHPPTIHNSMYVDLFCDIIKITPYSLMVKSNVQCVVDNRRLFAAWMWELTLVEIAELFDQDHTTIINLRRSHYKRLVDSISYARNWNLLCQSEHLKPNRELS